MIKELKISNYKSILNETIELSNVNVFIGENGCGKTNILESVAMLSAAKDNGLNINHLYSKGIRVTKPMLTISSFIGRKAKNEIEISAKISFANEEFKCSISPIDKDDIYSEWKDKIDLYIESKQNIESKFYKAIKSDEVQSKLNEEINKISKIELIESTDNSIELLKEKLVDLLKQQIINGISTNKEYISKYLIFNINTQSLRGIIKNSNEIPLGINGEGLDVLLNDFSKEEWIKLKEYSYLITWLDDILIDESDSLKYQGHKLGRSSSFLYFKDKFMRKNNNVFAAENSNEGVLNILFYLALFISRKTPKFFAIDNIESSLNPKLCRTLMKIISELAVEQNKQVLITTHNPAILDGMNLFDENQRLFVVKRSDEGDTRVERIKLKPEVQNKELKLSEMWMRGYLGGIPNNF